MLIIIEVIIFEYFLFFFKVILENLFFRDMYKICVFGVYRKRGYGVKNWLKKESKFN